MNANVYAHKSGPISRSFLKVVGLTDVKLVEVADQKSADIILLAGSDDLRVLYNERQLFCVLQIPGQRIASNQPVNVCLVDTLNLFKGDKGINSLCELIAKRQGFVVEGASKKVELPEFSDIATFKKRYSVLVIDDTEKNLRMAETVLDGNDVVVVGSLIEAIKAVRRRNFDAVLTDMEMPPDKHYPSLNLDHYAVDEKVPYGFAVVLEMTTRGIPVAVVTDGNHHEGWVSAMFDNIKGATVNGQKVLFFNNIGKRWDKALKSLMEG